MIVEEKTIEVEQENTYENERGKPMPSLDHSLIQTQLLFLLKSFFGKKFSSLSELSLKISHPGTTPDICIYPKMNRVIGQQPDIIKMTEPPLTTIEILSPTQALSELTTKIRDSYFPNGVKSAWVVLPELLAIAVYENGKNGYEWFNTGKLSDPVTGIELEVEKIFNVG